MKVGITIKLLPCVIIKMHKEDKEGVAEHIL